MAVKIDIPVAGNRDKTIIQLSAIFAATSLKHKKEVKVLGHMVRNSTGGVYVIRRGFKQDIAKAIGSTRMSVKDALIKLRRKGMISLVLNGRGGKYGVYVFNDVVQSLCVRDHHNPLYDTMIFNFVLKGVNNSVDKTNSVA